MLRFSGSVLSSQSSETGGISGFGGQSPSSTGFLAAGNSEGTEDSDQYEMIQHLIQLCLSSKWLCNELYLQLIKQTNDHPGMFSKKVAFLFLIVALYYM